jgi:hypothetical protein
VVVLQESVWDDRSERVLRWAVAEMGIAGIEAEFASLAGLPKPTGVAMLGRAR